MKKLLAMVLALVMTLSLAVSANAFKDDKSISDDYAEAVAVLNGMGVFKGYEDGSFKPEGNITRAEVATIVYRIYTADVAKNDKSGLYATYNKFSDMAGASWAAGYIGYCANASLVKGYPDGTFKPSGNVTGYEVLAMILRAVGYDKNGEFSGADWALHVAQTAQQLGILDNVDKTTDLNAPASRELVAELLFQGIQKDQVTYTPAFGYVTDKVTGKANSSLGTKNFELKSAKAADKWGRPATKWTYNTGDKATTVVAKADVSYTKAVAECDVAHDLGLSADTAYTLVVNGETLTAKYVVNLTDTVTKMGAQGRLFEVYSDAKTIVMIDTFLAKVESVKDAVYDAQGHLRTDATINLEVYDGNNSKLELTNGETNYGYVKGDYVLLNAKTLVTTNTAKTSGYVATATAEKYGEIIGKADSITGAQSVIYWNAQQHNVGGTVYDDAYKFILDQAGNTTENHTWYFDSYGNLIGAVDIAASYSYGVINSIWWAGNAADGTGVATATVTYMDGTTGTVTLSKITVDNATVNQPYDAKVGTPAYSYASSDVMTVDGTEAAVGNFFVTTNAARNAASDPNDIIADHLFQFSTKADGTVVAVEVSGNGTAASGTTAKANFRSLTTTVNKNTPYNNGLVINSETVFLVRSGAGTSASPFTYKTVTGVANIDKYAEGEVDYVLSNGVAQYVYIKAATTAANSTNLFYYDGASVNYQNGVWTIPGYIDGKPGDLKIENSATSGYDATAQAKVNTIINGGAHKMYKVALSDGVLAGFTGDLEAVTRSQKLTALVNGATTYALSDAYNTYDPYINVISGDSDDTYNGNVYYCGPTSDYSFLYVDGVTQKVGEDFTANMSDKDVIMVWNYDNNAAGSRMMLQAYVVNKNAVSTNAVVKTTTVANTVAAVAGNTVDSVKFTAQAETGTGFTTPFALTVSNVKFERQYTNPTTGATTWVEMAANEVLVSGTTYRATITIDVPSTMANAQLASDNVITYTAGHTTGVYNTVVTDVFTLR